MASKLELILKLLAITPNHTISTFYRIYEKFNSKNYNLKDDARSGRKSIKLNKDELSDDKRIKVDYLAEKFIII